MLIQCFIQTFWQGGGKVEFWECEGGQSRVLEMWGGQSRVLGMWGEQSRVLGMWGGHFRFDQCIFSYPKGGYLGCKWGKCPPPPQNETLPLVPNWFNWLHVKVMPIRSHFCLDKWTRLDESLRTRQPLIWPLVKHLASLTLNFHIWLE